MRISLLILMLMSINANAGPYFRLIDFGNINKSAGAYIDPFDSKNTSAGTATALITHSVKDGQCLFPTIICEDWSPLTAGFSVRAGRLDFNLGPSVNLTPLAKAGFRALLDYTTNEDTLIGLKSSLQSESISGASTTIAFGPAFAITPIQDGGVLAPEKWRGKFRIFAGAAWSFK